MTDSLKTAIAGVVRRMLADTDRTKCVAFLDSEPKDAGSLVKVGLRSVSMPFDGYMVYVDLLPEANWGHPVVYFLVSSDLAQTLRVDEHFPPFEGNAPSNFTRLGAN